MAVYDQIKPIVHSMGDQPLRNLNRLGEKFALSWYPSSGTCFRDLLSWRKLMPLGFPEPDIMIHTDYWPEINFEEGQVVHQNKKTTVTVTRKSEQSINENRICFKARSPYADFECCLPKLTLLEVQIESRQIGEFTKPVLFFHFENYNWFQQFVLRGDLKISHMFKLCEGCGFGGNRKSISSMYGLLGYMGCRYLLADQEIHFDPGMASRLSRYLTLRQFAGDREFADYQDLEGSLYSGYFTKYPNRLAQNIPPFEIETLAPFTKFSIWETFLHEIKPLRHPANPNWLNAALATISKDSPWHNPEWVGAVQDHNACMQQP